MWSGAGILMAPHLVPLGCAPPIPPTSRWPQSSLCCHRSSRPSMGTYDLHPSSPARGSLLMVFSPSLRRPWKLRSTP